MRIRVHRCKELMKQITKYFLPVSLKAKWKTYSNRALVTSLPRHKSWSSIPDVCFSADGSEPGHIDSVSCLSSACAANGLAPAKELSADSRLGGCSTPFLSFSVVRASLLLSLTAVKLTAIPLCAKASLAVIGAFSAVFSFAVSAEFVGATDRLLRPLEEDIKTESFTIKYR